MKLLDKLERRFRRFAVPNVIVWIIACQIFLFLSAFFNLGALERLSFQPAAVFEGEVWRCVTFLVMPPWIPREGLGLLFLFFYWMILHMMSTALEATWGTFRFNVYLLIGWSVTVAAVLGVSFVIPQGVVGNGFLYGSIFLAFAWLYPDYKFLIMFILPVKVKWLALIQCIGYGFVLLTGHWSEKALVLASIANFLLFFAADIYYKVRAGRRKMKMQVERIKEKHTPRHTCTVCGVTNLDDPKVRFRYCSKCDGSCYCSEHILNHEHIGEGHTVEAAEVEEEA